MDNKLQQLTQRLYDEGLEKGRSEADSLVAAAKSEAADIIAQAKNQAEAIVKEAKGTSEDLMKNSLTEISLAGKQVVAKIKSEITQLVISKSISEGIKGATMDGDFIKEMLISVAKNWDGSASGKVELTALLPKDLKSKLDESFKKNLKILLDAGIEVGYSDEVKRGFKVGAKDGGYYISFSDEDFDSLMRQYLREKVSRLIFNA